VNLGHHRVHNIPQQHRHSILQVYLFPGCTKRKQVLCHDSMILAHELALEKWASIISVEIPNDMTQVRSLQLF